MRILANYGVKTNGDSYTVTFETTGDVPSEKAPATVDELFRLAKEAIQRQLKGSPVLSQRTVPSSEAMAEEQKAVEVNSANGKPTIKDPSLPASPKQIRLLRRLARETGIWIGNLESLTMGQASQKIDELMAVRF